MADKENQLRVIRNRHAGHSKTDGCIFAYALAKRLTKLLQHRHGVQCDTDDAVVWFEFVLPFLVEASVIAGRDPHKAVVRWAEKHAPAYLSAIGIPNAAIQVDAALARREMAPLSASGMYVDWLPKMGAIVDAFRPTWNEVTGLKLLGFGSIDPPSEGERRELDRLRKQAQRRAKGAQPQSDRTKVKDLRRDAECIGISLRTLQGWLSAGNAVEMIRRRLERHPTNCTKLSAPYLLGKYGMDTFVQIPLAGNDDSPVRQTA